MIRGSAAAKLNLALVVGPRRDDGKHEVATLYQRIALTDRLEVRVSDTTAGALLVGMITYEVTRYSESRDRIRHLEVDRDPG